MNLLLDTHALLWWLDEQPFVDLAITLDHAHTVADLSPIHRDPFDRMLVAQAACEDLTIVTRDATIPRYGTPTLWA